MAEVIGLSALERRFAAIKSPVIREGFMRNLGLRAVREQKLLVHRKTGNLGRSIHVASVTQESVVTSASARYAAYVEYGTRAHEIRPVVKKVLAWGGPRRLTGTLRSGAKATHFARLVHHPGTRAYPYMTPGARKAVAETKLTDEIVAAWNGAA